MKKLTNKEFTDKGDYYFSTKDSHECRKKMSKGEIKKEINNFKEQILSAKDKNDIDNLEYRIYELNELLN